ncbi:hypothetical protein EV368DRAFT_67571 [Lentinula lateritia]|nr:hypothetical protein EV368DRAFT_67571 [Lentinula lateritia]
MVQICTVLGALLAAGAASVLALPVSVSEVGIVTDVPFLLQPSFVTSQERKLGERQFEVNEGKVRGMDPAVIEPLENRLIELSKEPTKDASYRQLLGSLISNLRSSDLLKGRLTTFSQSPNPSTLVKHALAMLIAQLRLAFQKRERDSSDHMLHEISTLSDFYQMKILSKWAGCSDDVSKQELNAHIDKMVKAKDATSKYRAEVDFDKWYQTRIDLPKGISGGNAVGGTSEKEHQMKARADWYLDEQPSKWGNCRKGDIDIVNCCYSTSYHSLVARPFAIARLLLNVGRPMPVRDLSENSTSLALAIALVRIHMRKLPLLREEGWNLSRYDTEAGDFIDDYTNIRVTNNQKYHRSTWRLLCTYPSTFLEQEKEKKYVLCGRIKND